MIKTKTALILGAGASIPYRYPSMEELRKDICNNIVEQKNSKILNTLELYGEDIRKFRFEFFKSGAYSIDQFLENRKEFRKIGKIAIALELLKSNRLDDLNSVPNSENWYRLIFNKMNDNFNDFDRNDISFITFNYDLSLEVYLFDALQSYFGKTKKVAIEKLNKINIVHLYGSIGSFSDIKKLDLINDNNTKAALINSAANNIKIMSDGGEYDEDFNKAHELLRKAKLICFLGFGFNETNLERLKLTELDHRKQIQSTEVNLPELKKRYVKTFLDKNNMIISFYKGNIVDLFNEHVNIN